MDRSWGDTGYRDTDAGYRDTDPGYSFEEPQDTVHSGTKRTLRNNFPDFREKTNFNKKNREIPSALCILKNWINFAVKNISKY